MGAERRRRERGCHVEGVLFRFERLYDPMPRFCAAAVEEGLDRLTSRGTSGGDTGGRARAVRDDEAERSMRVRKTEVQRRSALQRSAPDRSVEGPDRGQLEAREHSST